MAKRELAEKAGNMNEPKSARGVLGRAFEFKMSDPVNHPAHYTFSEIEVIDAIEAWDLSYHAGNVVKYIAKILVNSQGKII